MSTEVQETGMLDVGTHCAYCRQIDFLPFHCKYCDSDFCSKHRLKEDHHCSSLINSTNVNNNTSNITPNKSDGGKFFRSLLPQRSHVRLQNSNSTINQNNDKSPTIKSTLNKSSLDKLLKFFKSRQKKPIIKSRSASKITQLAQLKKVAKGDSKIPEQNKIYLFATVIDDDINTSKENVPVYINKMWPVGRVLDSVANLLGVKNINIKVDTSLGEKLFIYKQTGPQGTIHQLETGSRAVDTFSNMDNIFIIRGTEA
ncbi:similar to Saccharomyces cerevisiae YNL155W CUZ1 Putative protein of unknown function [Maudiozyma saulgeensis]|uniref:AN1-type domain-containing protein n=1 Tax=Maudiozyma saulgeensis TaxID=1789683 RepID=A0A1X7RB45_9SACH|nr:similar to Saccharomyces cerevisiae YNL155W CUZ1 Putative protein of unknown function [Kazachstania saulgeensis]